MSRRKQSNPKPVKRDDELAGGMDDDSLNGGDTKSSALSMEEEEELEEDGVSLTTTSSSAAASPPPPQPPPLAHPLPSHRGRPPSRPPSEEADQSSVKSTVFKTQIAPTPPPPPPPAQQQTTTSNMAAAVKRRREIEQDELIIVPSASRPSPPAQLAVPGLPTQHPLLSADLLHSLQYFALLRQSIPNGSLMNLPVAPPPPPPPPPPIPNRLSPTPPASSKSSAGLNHMCPSCGICFSSASTLSAHATYYCSKRPQVSPAAAPVTSASPLPTLPTQPEMMANVAALSNGRSQTPEPMDELLNDRPSAPKIRRSGRYYACPYCSFSADKRVSLNRHMRVHVGLPLLATHPVSPPPLPAGHLETSRSLSSDRPTAGSSPEFRAMNKLQEEPAHRSDAGADRFCSDCKIQFSSFKTFQVHKQHYCQSRKMAGANLPAGSPVLSLEKSIPAGETLAGRAQNAGGGPMTILMLPTHPPIVIPLCILQSARLLTADQPMPPHSVIVSPHGDIQFRADSPEDPRSTASSAVVTPAASTTPAAVASVPAVTLVPSAPVTPVPPATSALPAEPPLTANAATVPPETALDLSSKTSESDPAATESSRKEPVTKESVANSNATGGIRIREELAHVNQSSPDNPSQQQQQQQQPALPFLPPKVFAELEALGMCLGVPSGHDMTSNPAQWLAMLENAVLQASFKAPATVSVVPSSNKTDLIQQAQRPSSAIPCEECNISFRRMESYLVHKQYYCAARHQQPGQPAGKGEAAAPAAEQVNGNQPEEPAAAPAIHRDPVIQRANKHACPLCGIEFESAVVLQAHRSFYCPKREIDPALKNAPDVRKVNAESLAVSPNASGPSPGHNGSPTAGGSGSIQPQGWKCPCCDVVSPTAASAQKHVETHANVRAFRCSVCGYRGNTLRGMRTHVRIHFDRRNADLCEDNYISCIMGGTGAVGEFNPAAGGGMPNSPPDVDQIFKSLGIPPEVCAKVLSAAHPQSADSSVGNARDRRELGGSSLAGLQFLQLAQRIANHSPGPTTGAGCRSDKLFLCDLCCYSSSYRGNVIRHSKLVHGREISEVAVVSSNFLQQAVNNNPAAIASKPPFPDANASAIRMKTIADHSPPPRPALINTPSSLPTSRMMSTGSPDEAIQVKIDPDDVMMMHQSSTGGSNSSHSGEGHSPPLSNVTSDFHSGPAGTASGGTDPFRKHCKSCNITFTYMNTFLAHKKYYCSSQAPLEDQDQDRDQDRDDNLDEMDDEDDELEAETSASPPPAPAHHSEATPT